MINVKKKRSVCQCHRGCIKIERLSKISNMYQSKDVVFDDIKITILRSLKHNPTCFFHQLEQKITD